MNIQKWRRRFLLVLTPALALAGVAASVLPAHHGWIGSPFPGFFVHSNLTVGPVFLPHWSGKESGLRLLDRVLAVDGQPVAAAAEIYDAVRSRPAATRFPYTIERDGSVVTVAVHSMTFSFRDWFFTFGIYLLTGLAFLTIGAVPCYLRSPSPAARPLFLLGATIFVWFASTFDFMATQWAPKEIRILALVLTPSLGIHLALSLTDSLPRRRKGIGVIYFVSAILGLFYSAAFHGPNEIWQWALRLSYLYGCVAAFVFLGLVWFALRRPISDLDGSRLRAILVGAVVGFLIPTLGAVLASSFYYEIPYNLLMIPALFFPLSVAYALVKHNLFDIDTVVKAGLTRAAVAAALLIIYVSIVAVLSLSLGDDATDPLVPLFFSVLVVLVFNPLLRWVERGVDRYFYQREYDPMELQSEVSGLLRSLSRPHGTAANFLRIVARHLGLDAAFVLFQSGDSAGHTVVALQEGRQMETLSPAARAAWMRHFSASPKGLFRGEVETDPAYEERRAELLRLFEELEAEVLMPLIFERQLLGLVSLGKKKSRAGHSADDFSILAILADQLALALKNGALYEESERATEEYKRLYDRSEALNRRLVEMDRLKRQFVANVSHELRTPIAAISGYAEVLLEPVDRPGMDKILERLVTNSRELSGLVEGLLDFSRLEAGTMAAAHDSVSLRNLLDSIETIALRLIRNRPIRFRKFTAPSVDVIYTDPKKLQQILMQLLTNAVKFTDEGEIAVEVKSHKRGDDDAVEISVSDTGVGISAKDREIIFEEFRQLDGSSTRRHGGTGLGLNLCRKLAETLGGRIEVESSVGEGSTFSVILPQGKRAVDYAAEFQAV